jgi:hypothetical protein
MHVLDETVLLNILYIVSRLEFHHAFDSIILACASKDIPIPQPPRPKRAAKLRQNQTQKELRSVDTLHN